jgi:thiol-disulfide isomerase/thioredoxin
VVFTLKGEGKFDSKSDLMIEGEVSASKAENVKDLTKALNEGALKDVSPGSYRFDIEVKPSTGGPFIPIKDLVDIYNQEDKSIEHKEGQVLLIDFWATWCPPC